MLLKRLGYSKGVKALTQTAVRSMSSLGSDIYAHKFLTSNMFGIVRSPLYEAPYISVNKMVKK